MQRVAITGVGIVSPIGRGFAEFADQLLGGKVGTRRLTDVFGASYDGIPVRHAAPVTHDLPSTTAVDEASQHRSTLFAIDAVAQAVAAGSTDCIASAGLHCGVGVGQLAPEFGDYERHGAARVLAELEAQLRSVSRDPELQLRSALRADAGTAYLQERFGLRGTPGTYVGACSASTQACISACEDVVTGAEFAVGGGHDTLLSPAGIHLMYELGTLTEEPETRPFDVSRDGTLLGEGAVYFLFERLEHAIARKAHVFAEVVGWASSADGYHITTPDPSGDVAVDMLRRALDHAGVPPERIDYVNAHGTGTVLNDTLESNVIARALSGHRAMVSSTKAQVGHLIAACGAIGLAASLVGIERQLVPPNPNLRNPDPECVIELAGRTAQPAVIDHVLCNSFGFGGQNSCLVLRRHLSSEGAT